MSPAMHQETFAISPPKQLFTPYHSFLPPLFIHTLAEATVEERGRRAYNGGQTVSLIIGFQEAVKVL